MTGRYRLLFITLAVAVALSLFSFVLVRHWEQNRTVAAFRGIASDRVYAIQEGLRDDMRLVDYLRAVYLSSDAAKRDSLGVFIREFRSFTLDPALQQPEIRSMAFLPRVPAEARPSVVSAVRAEGWSEFEILDRAPGKRSMPAPVRSLYFPVVSAEPMPEASSLLGDDFWADPRYRDAMKRAVDSGRAAATQPSRPEDNPSEGYSFWLFDALVLRPSQGDALGGTRSELKGFVAIEYRVDELIERSVAAQTPAGIDILAYDAVGEGGNLLWTHESRTRSRAGTREKTAAASSVPFTWSTSVHAGGLQWKITALPAPDFLRSHTYFVSWAVLSAGVFSTAITAGFLFFSMRRGRRVERLVEERTAELTREIAHHKNAEESLRQAQGDIARWADALRQHSREIELLGEMGDMLQTCHDLPEAYHVAARFARELFPSESGILYVFHESRKFLVPVATWGEPLDGDALLLPDGCWAIRRGKPHLSTNDPSSLRCEHLAGVSGEPAAAFLCTPLAAQGETLGLLHLARQTEAPQGGSAVAGFGESQAKLASAVAEHAALAFANLSLRETLRLQSIRDPLTGLFNRRYMEESLEREIHRARRAGSPLGLMIVDIDYFKKFNDTYGHEAGDQVLRSVGRLFQESLRGEDIPCRFGGEEFVLILPGASLESSMNKAEDLRRRIEGLRVEHGGQRLASLSISAGIAVVPDHGFEREALFQAADAALYAAKQAGRNRAEVAKRIRVG